MWRKCNRCCCNCNPQQLAKKMGRKQRSSNRAQNTVELDESVLDSFLPPGIVAKKKNPKKQTQNYVNPKNASLVNSSDAKKKIVVEDEDQDLEKEKLTDSTEFVFVENNKDSERVEVEQPKVEVESHVISESVVVIDQTETVAEKQVQNTIVEQQEIAVEKQEIEKQIVVEQVKEEALLSTTTTTEDISAVEDDLTSKVARADAMSIEALSLNEPENSVKVTVEDGNYVFQSAVPELAPVLEEYTPDVPSKQQIEHDDDDLPRKKKSWFFCCS
jgi:hypothetical protein